MGKFPASTIHNWFSDWHYQRCNDAAYLTDVDRLWLEVRQGRPIAVFDLKWRDSPDQETYCEDMIRQWFEQHGVPYYVIRVELIPAVVFRIHREMDHAVLSERQMINWINDSLSPDTIFPQKKMEE
jgi:hypothetical protein